MTRIDSAEVGATTRGQLTAFEQSLVPRPSAPWTRRRKWWALLAALIALAIVAPLTWWQVDARTYRLSSGDRYFGGPAATTLTAGNVTELCYPEVAGGTVVFGVSVENDGAHVLTLTGVGRIFFSVDQTVTSDPATTGGASGPAAATQHLPLTIRPGQSRNLYFTVAVPSGQTYMSSHTVAHVIDLRFRVLGVNRTQHFTYGQDGTSPLWFGLSGKDDNGHFCDYTRPPMGQ